MHIVFEQLEFFRKCISSTGARFASLASHCNVISSHLLRHRSILADCVRDQRLNMTVFNGSKRETNIFQCSSQSDELQIKFNFNELAGGSLI